MIGGGHIAAKWRKMEAFPTIFLVTKDSVLASAIPAQLSHALKSPCEVYATWNTALEGIAQHAPAVLLLDAALSPLPDLAAFRQDHPLTALLLIGGNDITETALENVPLSSFTPRPVALPALIRSVEHLAYMRQITAGQQALKLVDGTQFLPHRKIIETHNSQSVNLTDKEVALLLCLYHHRQEKLPRQNLLEEVWGYSEGVATHTLETHLYRLRQKLKEATGSDSLVRTDQGTYQLVLS